ncbi:glycoside hydrolase family 13 protein [Mycetocola zhujimingii]|uniref:glycoside hydrolase family 13 protein n=1 Tax=Mycetocola zhujimingii TaxID=2079792 RepID=UPI000D387473|nr:glycoside hydrolase family 13 protein [Mycetocola zhujimingii]AWB85518.1 alpha-amylase [Mycetocola zhujimingii]
MNTPTSPEWWRSAVIYQIYPRSFADANGDGIGDLPGITSRLGSLSDLGIDAIWLSPFMTSPQKDAGYDVANYCDVDPLFGTLDDFDRMTAKAHENGIRVIVDLVPNHSSDAHEWFQAALAAGPGSPERAHYMFRDGKGENGELPPNNWQSVFGGPAWTRTTNPDGTAGQWYLHLFDSSQPDFDWTNEDVRTMFRDVLRFWLDRGVDGFRVDVAHGMIKADGLPDYTPPAEGGSMGGTTPLGLEPGIDDFEDIDGGAPYWGQEGVHDIYRDWHQVLEEYEGDRVLCAEAWVEPLANMAKWVRPDEMQQAFNFPYLETPWEASALRAVIEESLEAFSSVGAPSTWVLSNHDVVRHASRLALTAENPQGHGIGPKSPGQPVREIGLQRARAATALMLALPGGAYIYQGEELGLPEVIDLPDDARQDPTWFRTNRERYGRDGCRVPIPWEAGAPAYGFNSTGDAWLPQPADWAPYARDAQVGVEGSTLELYREALRVRREQSLGLGTLEWIDGLGDNVIAFTNGTVTVVANTSTTDVALPASLAGAELILSSGAFDGATLAGDTTVWLRTP